MRRKVVLIHLWVISTLVAGLGLLYRFADNAPDKTVFHTVHVTAMMVVIGCGYYMLFELFRRVAPTRWGLGRRHTGQAYSEMEARPRASAQDPVTDLEEDPSSSGAAAAPLLSQARLPERPRLNMSNVCWLVYGLGFVFFVSIYCFSGQQTLCSYYFVVGLCCLCLDELFAPLGDSPFAARARLLECAAVALAFVGATLLLVVHNPPDAPFPPFDIFSLATGVILPIMAPLTLYGLKESKEYTTRDMLELCEFGLPFMFILGAGFVIVSDAQSVRLMGSIGLNGLPMGRHTWKWTDGGDAAGVTFLLFLGPLLALPVLVFVTTAALRGHASDPLIAFMLVFAGRALLEQGVSIVSDPVCLAAVASVKLAVIARLASTSHTPDPPLRQDEASVNETA